MAKRYSASQAIVPDVADEPISQRHAHTLRFVRAQEIDWRPGFVLNGKPTVE